MEERFIVRNSSRFGNYVLTDVGFACGGRAEKEAIQFTEEQAKAVCNALNTEVSDATEVYFRDERKKSYQFVDTNVEYEPSKKAWEYLNPEVKAKFIMNILNMRGEEFLGRLENGYITGGFVWSESPEGNQYWNGVEKEVLQYIAENK